MHRTPRSLVCSITAAVLALPLGLAACGASPGSPPASAGGSKGQVRGTAEVAYAGSLEKLFTTVLTQDFQRASGDTLTGPPGAGSLALAQEIISGEISPGAFLSIGAKAIKKLWPARATFSLVLATDPLVVAYSPRSRYATELDAIRKGSAPLSSLFSLFEKPGFRLGRTDPNQDPQGQFFILMVELAAKVLHLPASTAQRILGVSAQDSIGDSSQVFSETALPTMIATGNVDAGSSFLPEARQYHLDYITLPPALSFSDPADSAQYGSVSLRLTDGTVVTGETITLDATLVRPAGSATSRAADRAADAAFIAYLLSPAGAAVLRQSGYALGRPVLQLAPGAKSAAAVLPPVVLTQFDRLDGIVASP